MIRRSSIPAGKSKQRGTVLIEFGLVLPFLLVVTLTVVDLSRAYFLKSMVGAAARQGARVAVVHGDATQGDARDSVVARVNKVLSSSLNNGAGVQVVLDSIGVSTLDLSPPFGGTAYDHYEVRVVLHYQWLYLGLLNYFGASVNNPQTLTATAVMRKE